MTSRRLRLAVRCVVALCAAAAVFISRDRAAAVDDPQWQLPPGFTIELVAGPPLVNHPTMGGFDDQGRLYLCDGPGENMPAKDLLSKFPNYIRRLEDTDGDGKFDRSTMFADRMTFPMGALWHDGYVYIASPPHIWKLRDADGDGTAEERKILVSEFGFTGNAADIHGCFLGPDGRIYWCDGRHGHNFVDEQGNQISKGLAARLFSCKTDGSDVQAFAGGGMDNPVEVAFTDEGEPLGTVAIYDSKPDRVDAIIHWVYGGAYPYHPKVMDEFKKTGDLLPAVSRFGRVAPSGIVRYRHPHFGEEYLNNLFHAQFNTHRVIRTKLERDGATFKSVDEDFLVSPHPDVHLTDVIEDADGSLLVVDTGGWFRIGCPTSQIAKPDILGGVYRIRRTDGRRIDDPRGLTLAWDEASTEALIPRMADARPAVRDRTVATLTTRVRRDPKTAATLHRTAVDASLDVGLRRNAVWTLVRAERRDLIPSLLAESTDDGLLQVALHGVDRIAAESNGWFGKRLAAAAPALRREIATTVGRVGARTLLPDVLAALRTSSGDRFLEHALIYALIQLNEPSSLVAALNDDHPNVRRGALIALDQLGGDRLTREAVARMLDTTDANLQTTVLGVMQKHADWAPAVVGWLKTRLAARSPSAAQAELVRRTFLAYKNDPEVRDLLAKSLAATDAGPAQVRMLLEVIEQSELTGGQLPRAWIEPVARRLTDADEGVLRQAIATAAIVGAPAAATPAASGPFDGPLMAVARDARRSASARVAALRALGPRVGSPDDALFEFLYDRLRTAGDALDRLAAADVLGSLPLNPAQRAAVVAAVASAGPLELPPLLTLFEKDSLPDEGRRLVDALARSPGLENLTSARLERIVSAYPDDVRRAAEPLFKRINADIETQRARLAELTKHLDGGDVVRGKNLFTLKTTACINCHKVAGQGAQIGPDLSKVGQIRSRADLLESIVFPSASFVRGYESVAVATTRGLEHVGIVARETPEAVYLKTAQREEIRIPRGEIDELRPSKLSIMPQGMDKLMTPDELRDLIAYLQTLK